jgi:hypothetical protein
MPWWQGESIGLTETDIRLHRTWGFLPKSPAPPIDEHDEGCLARRNWV